jgi:hypothetical protein
MKRYKAVEDDDEEGQSDSPSEYLGASQTKKQDEVVSQLNNFSFKAKFNAKESWHVKRSEIEKQERLREVSDSQKDSEDVQGVK